jgi:catechol 2,3-dioxygenase-like lactoylglutathione lyase family enzyme
MLPAACGAGIPNHEARSVPRHGAAITWERAMTFKLNHVHLKTKDPEATAKFYVDTLDAKIVGKAGSGGYRLDLHGLSLNVTDFLANQTRDQKLGIEHIAIDTDELDALVQKLEARGIKILEQTVVSGGRRVCFFEGPDGVQLEFIEMKA